MDCLIKNFPKKNYFSKITFQKNYENWANFVTDHTVLAFCREY